MSHSTKVVMVRSGPTSGVRPPAKGRETDELLARAHQGDKSCLPEVKALLAESDRGPSFVEFAGSPAKWLRQSIADKAAGDNVLVSEAVQRKIDKVQADLEGPNPTPIERLLAERAALCWFVVNFHEERLMSSGSMSPTQAEYSQRRIDRAHKRFLSAVETLARVRKMAVPSLMVNVARNQQVNVAGNSSKP